MDATLVQMTAPDSGSFYTVTDPKQAQLLTEPKSKAFFKPFLARERSASEAAALLGCSLNTALYRIKTFLAAGLIEVVREGKRKGRAVKYYRSRYDAYFIPFSLTPYATLEERLEVQAAPIFANLIRAYAAALRQNDHYGHHIFLAGDKTVWTSDLLPELTPAGLPVVYSDTVVGLQNGAARTLGEDLRDVFRRGTSSDTPQTAASSHYMFMVALLPIKDAQPT